MLNNEVADSNSKQVHQELEEAREAVSRLTAHHARSVGWDTRLMAALQEKEDMQQERDSESQRARLAESRIVALRERASKLSHCLGFQVLISSITTQINYRQKLGVFKKT